MDVQKVSIMDNLKSAFAAQSNSAAPAAEAPRSTNDAVPQAAEQPKAPDAAAPATPAEDPQLAPRFARLKQDSQKLQQERQAWAAEQKKYGERLSKLEQWEKVIAGAESDPMALVTLAGKAPDEFVKLLTERGTVSPELREILKTREELAALKAERDQEKTAAQAAREQQERAYYRQLVATKVASDNRFPLASKNAGPDDILDVMQQHYANQVAAGEVNPQGLHWEKAAEMVENYLRQQLKPILETDWAREYITKAAPSASQATSEPGPTLNSAMSGLSSPKSTSTSADQSNSAEDPIAKVAAELQKLFGAKK